MSRLVKACGGQCVGPGWFACARRHAYVTLGALAAIPARRRPALKPLIEAVWRVVVAAIAGTLTRLVFRKGFGAAAKRRVEVECGLLEAQARAA